MPDPLNRAEHSCPPEAMGRLEAAVGQALAKPLDSGTIVAAVLDEIVAIGGSWSIPAKLEPRKARNLKGGVE